MKMRLKGDSLRLRLSQTEVSEIGRGQPVSSQTRFGGDSALLVTLRPDHQASSMRAHIKGQHVEVLLPEPAARRWAADDEAVSLREVQEIPDGELILLVEKDFQCLAPRPDEDESDLFPHPETSGHHQCD